MNTVHCALGVHWFMVYKCAPCTECSLCYGVQVCALHWVFILLVTVAVPSSERVQKLLCRACVTITALLLIVRMIYQIEYIDAQGIAANCSVRLGLVQRVSSILFSPV